VNSFERTLIALSDGGVSFIVIGGVAISVYGSARVTFDLDICIDEPKHNHGKRSGRRSG